MCGGGGLHYIHILQRKTGALIYSILGNYIQTHTHTQGISKTKQQTCMSSGLACLKHEERCPLVSRHVSIRDARCDRQHLVACYQGAVNFMGTAARC